VTAPLHDLPDPVCESHIHEFGPFAPAPLAAGLADWHGCADVYLCSGCLTALGDAFERRSPIACRKCQHPFHRLADFITWREL
jgi:hypothetical protein